MLVEDIEKTLATQGVSREEVRFHVDQMVQNMAIYESNPGMYTIQSLRVFCESRMGGCLIAPFVPWLTPHKIPSNHSGEFR